MAMAMRKRQREMPAPSGSVIVWMAGLVFGAGAGIVLVYHMLLASHAAATRPLRDDVTLAAPAPAPARTAAGAASEMRQEHAQALQDAMKPTRS